MLQRVRSVVEHISPKPICAHCIGAELNSPGDPRVAMEVFQLLGHDSIASVHGPCSVCDRETRLVQCLESVP